MLHRRAPMVQAGGRDDAGDDARDDARDGARAAKMHVSHGTFRELPARWADAPAPALGIPLSARRPASAPPPPAALPAAQNDARWSSRPPRRLVVGARRLPGRQRAHQLADDRQHDLVGAAADRHEPAVAVVAAHLGLGHVAHAAPVLQALVGHLALEPPRRELRHRRELGDVAAGQILLDRAIDQRAQQLDLGLELGQPVVHDLVVEDALAEGLAAPRILDGVGDDALHLDEAARRRPEALLLELLHLVDEAHALLADAEALRHAHAVEKDLRRVGGAHAELVELARDLDAFGLHRHADQRLVAVDRALAGIGEEAHPIGLRAVGGPHLAAVDDVVAAVLPGPRPDAGDVGAGARLGDAEAGDIVAGDARPQELLAQLVRAVARQGRRRHVGMDADRHGDGRAAAGAERLAERHLVGIVEALAAEPLGLVDAEEALAAHLLEQLMRRENAGLLPFVDMRVDLGLAEAGDRAHELPMLLAIDHRPPPMNERSAAAASSGFSSTMKWPQSSSVSRTSSAHLRHAG